MALGIKQALSGGYTRVFVHTTGLAAKPHVLLIAGVSLFLITVRFSWVPRSLSAYAVVTKPEKLTSRFTRLMGFHFPVTMIHAMLYFTVCQIFDDLETYHLTLPSPSKDPRTQMQSRHEIHAGLMHLSQLETRLVVFFGGLLALNAIWLIAMTDRQDPMPGWFWGLNNALFSIIAVGLWFGLRHDSEAVRVTAVFVAFTVNGVIDLIFTSEYYVLFYGEVPKPRRLMGAIERVLAKIFGGRETAAPEAVPVSTDPPETLVKGLTDLAELHAMGSLTDAEFAAAKSRLLG